MNKIINPHLEQNKQSYISNPFKLIFKGFSDMFKYNQTISIIILVFGIIGYLGNFNSPTYNFNSTPEQTSTAISNEIPSISAEMITTLVIILLGVLMIIIPIILVITTIYQGAVAYTALQTSRKKTVSVNDALSAVFSKFWTIIYINLIVFLKVFGGTLLFIVPGVRASLRYKMVLMHMFDKNLNAKDSINQAKTTTKDHLIEVLGMSFASAIVPFIGAVLDAGGQAVMYPQLINLKSSSAKKPDVHWLNYLAFILFGGFVLLMIFFVLIVLALT
jgi:hypothetical protein